MDSLALSNNLYCPQHPEEVIIKVSLALDLNDQKSNLLFCSKCLQQSSQGNNPNLVDFRDLIPALQQHTTSEERIHNNLSVEAYKQIFLQINRIGKELKKIEDLVLTLLQDSKTVLHSSSFIALEDTLKTYTHQFSLRASGSIEGSNVLNSIYKLQDKLKNQIQNSFSQANSRDHHQITIEIENNLKSILQLSNLFQGKTNLTTFYPQILNQKINHLVRAEFFKKFLEDISSAIHENNVKGVSTIENTINSTVSEANRQRKSCSMRTIAIKSLIKNAETMIAKIGSLAENGVKRPVNNSVCSLSVNGLKGVSSRAYRCRDCAIKHGLKLNDLLCEACKDNCHQGHEIEFLEVQNFACQCQMKMKDCRLATCCTFKYTGTNYVSQSVYHCIDEKIQWGKALCSFCVKHCHKGHTISFKYINTSFCDCSILTKSCLFLKENS